MGDKIPVNPFMNFESVLLNVNLGLASNGTERTSRIEDLFYDSSAGADLPG